MPKPNPLIKRFQSPKQEKFNELIKRSSSKMVAGFSKSLPQQPLSEAELERLRSLLTHNQSDQTVLESDLKNLSAITAEVRTIDHQAILLHGQRIKQAQYILKKYQKGTFTAWLIQVYGNRQTPYNFLQYYELYHSLSFSQQKRLSAMPKQAVYTLSSRDVPQEKKACFVEDYRGENKYECLQKLRREFPLDSRDKRKSNYMKRTTSGLRSILQVLDREVDHVTEEEYREVKKWIDQIHLLLLKKFQSK